MTYKTIVYTILYCFKDHIIRCEDETVKITGPNWYQITQNQVIWGSLESFSQPVIFSEPKISKINSY